MKINVSRPFQIIQWSSYVFAIFVVQFVIVLPLAFMLFNDFYRYLIPSDSSQLVPLSAFNLTQNGESHFHYYQELDKVPAHTDLPTVKQNGLVQHIPLREHIDYRIDAIFKFYCLIDDTKTPRHNIQDTTVSVYGYIVSGEYVLLYSKYVPIVCLTTKDSITLPDGRQLKGSRIKQYKTEWLNEIILDDISDFSTDSNIKGLAIRFNYGSIQRDLTDSFNHGFADKERYSMLMNIESQLNFRINFNQGIRNLMLRYHLTTYVIGTVVFHLTISSLMMITAAMAFYITNQKLAADNSNRDSKKPKRRTTEGKKA
ncbi:similar to Saccharomyces cerevisiae YLR404W FLD1 Seipin protein involved in lipid droplet morphology, number, and size [Maudiozyma barnettii]|uniref:Similar to Saccharomyces cerevisiae YLR404W FLD1 Seipin protein involved in lipid droplet morphology, number, and size n=1 Tax=Maudiozyma barnettii TaxID=61262 RepID=A0A8H2VIB5_9SACH|nr:seipin [Kazachstania barnettii]CAB4256174.1 similar to Saccharomyces cerevisiae YLR404W FLD1 Seipin protein involved in lipid droplet morphology, number, and size [Kazachstania barnettii]CAD1784782.1 similar to Saccharomyces cerevisiae YLR404W FLD1 Seipin protein involved in lipid droplet morphology, number, and size [Kazachstania barnettii]